MKKFLTAALLLLVPVLSVADWTTHGFTIPTAHPRLWWNATRLSAAQTWLAANPFTPGATNYWDMAFQHAVDNTDCSTAVTWAAGWAPTPGQVLTTAIGSDDMRGVGERVLLVYDWCFDQWSAGQKSTFITNWNGWIDNVRQQTWGGPTMPQSNYFWGNLRNELEYGIITYGDNGEGAGSFADNMIESALVTRWTNAFVPTTVADNTSSGGILREGPGYGSSIPAYSIIPVATLLNMGRDLYSETSFFSELLYAMLYNTTPASTQNKDFVTNSTYVLSMWNEDEGSTNGGVLWQRNYYEDWMAYFAQHAASPMNGYARQWLSLLTPIAPLQYDPNATATNDYYVSNFIISNDPGGSASAYSSLPLDHYMTGMPQGSARTAWDNTSAVVYYYIAEDTTNGHLQYDFGSFNFWRGGRWVLRETSGYSDSIAGTPGINSGSAQDSGSPLSHNVPAFTNIAIGQVSDPGRMSVGTQDMPTVERLESASGYFYIDEDLTNTYTYDGDFAQYNTGVVGHVEREFIYLRSLEILVILDRVTTANQTYPSAGLTAAQVETSFVTHFETNPTVTDNNHYFAANGDQALNQIVLIPTVAIPRIITEGGTIGQYRVEVPNSGAAQRYHLHVLQATDNTGTSNVTASLLDSNEADPTSGTFTVTIHPTAGSDTVIVFNKGQASSGGTVNIAGAGAVSLRADVQGITYTDSGPVWAGATAAAVQSISPGVSFTGTIH